MKKKIFTCAVICVFMIIGSVLLIACDDKEQAEVQSTNHEIIVEKMPATKVAKSDNTEEADSSEEVINIDVSEAQQDLQQEEEPEETENPDEEEDTEKAEDFDTTEDVDKTENSDGIEDTEETEKIPDIPVPVAPGSVEQITLNPNWMYAASSAICSGSANLYRAAGNRRNVVVGVNAGHGTKGGQSVKTYCHPDMSAKVTGGTTGAGATMAVAVSGGMTFLDGTAESAVTLRMAEILRDKLLAEGFDVLMLRDGSDVQLDNVARTVICNNVANCHIALHWDGDNLSYDKGCFYISTPDGIKGMEPVASHWTMHEALGQSLIAGLSASGCKIYKNGSMSIDLTQTSYSTVPSVDLELGNAASVHDDGTLSLLADGIVSGLKNYF